MKEPNSKKGLSKLVFSFLVLLIAIFFGADFGGGDFSGSQDVVAIEVIDGDTIRVRDIATEEVFSVRYLGLDTPELDGPNHETCFADQATEYNRELIEGERLTLRFDIDQLDRFGRTLAYVYTEDETFVNQELLQQGFARFYLDKQNTLLQDELIAATLSAQAAPTGLWGACGEPQFNNKCIIKGNVDRTGQKFYHFPQDKYYSQTTINLEKEDQWLCTAEEAEAKNFTPPLK